MSSQDNQKTEKSETALREEKILDFWQKEKVFQKTLLKDSPKGEFIFYEGPPTTNGKPGIHHLEARSFKDIISRYKTMQGFHVSRKGGWDTHGLPVELQVEKQLGLKSKKEIEEYGVEAFNQKCRESVGEYLDLWNAFTKRIGYWVDQENPYNTYDKTYMESVWNIIKTVNDKKLLYKDYKVVPWCPRCGTGLSSHELAQGYEEVKDLSVYVKFKVVGQENAYLLAWTTTPWTLPGNVGLAVGKDIEYVKVKIGDEFLILAKSRLTTIQKEYEVLEEIKGADLVGLSYEPLFPYLKEKFADKNPESFEKAYKVYAADFVTTEDGTGIVHTAVMYGQEDFDLGTKVGLPKFHLVNPDGHFLDDMGILSGRYVKEKNADGKPTLDVDIINYLKEQNLFFAQENYKHSYPHCWRCKTPLIYYARDSWYIRMSELRDELVAENESINWEPSHIKEGRFGEWLKEVKDWAISRERYWGTPLPVWSDSEGNISAIGSVKELKSKIKKRNNFFLIRHGQSEGNVVDKISCDITHKDPLTSLGEEEAKTAGESLGDKKIDVIITSPFQRTRETAKIIAQAIGFTGEIVEDKRLIEINAGDYDGKPWGEYLKHFDSIDDHFTKHTGTRENWEDVHERVSRCMYELDAQYEGKNILVVSHGSPLLLIEFAAEGFSQQEIIGRYYDNQFKNAEIREIDWRKLPHNEKFEIDLHKPFIDEVELFDEKGRLLTRAKEVMDVWLDSGSMPFAQHHFMNDGESHKLPYPADFISEAIDQTRGWFYTLHAVGILTGFGKAYKNVICLGHILDENGKKMSKSLGNIVEPNAMIDKYGVDALRLWMYSVNQPGDSKNFDERTVDEIVKKVFNLLENIYTFYALYTDDSVQAHRESTHVLDRWILARLDEVVREGSRALDGFNVFTSARLIRDFAGDFSTWYVRRSRDRFKSDDLEDKRNALSTTAFVLETFARYMAPFTPFFAEHLYQSVHGDKTKSVHESSWPSQETVDTELLTQMQKVRDVVSTALQVRSKANIKVRQPLASLVVKGNFSPELRSIIADEVNVKEVASDPDMTTELELDTLLTPDLIEEGIARDLIRAIQDARKKENLVATQTIDLTLAGIGSEFLEQWGPMIQKPTGIQTITVTEAEGKHALVLDNLLISFDLVY